LEHLKDASLGLALALPENTRLGQKGLLGTNTVAYYGNPSITGVISFLAQGAVHNDPNVWQNGVSHPQEIQFCVSQTHYLTNSVHPK
jgi:hypothetical protein